MRPTKWILTLAMALAACKSAPEAAPEAKTPPPAAKPAEPPLALTALTTAAQTMDALTLRLEGKLAPGVAGRELEWTARVGDAELGKGKETLPGPGPFSLELPLSFGKTAQELAPFQGSETQQVVVEVSVANGASALTESRSAYVRSPKLPVAKIINVQAGRPEPGVLEITYLLSIANPNPWEVRVGTVKYTALLADKTLATSDLMLGARVPASSDTQFEVPAVANAQNVGKEINALLKKPELPWSFKGSLTSGSLELPIDSSGTMKVSAE